MDVWDGDRPSLSGRNGRRTMLGVRPVSRGPIEEGSHHQSGVGITAGSLRGARDAPLRTMELLPPAEVDGEVTSGHDHVGDVKDFFGLDH